ncbi:MAG: hypothetical protein ACYC27_22205 [Armatimonadota bacterium]
MASEKGRNVGADTSQGAVTTGSELTSEGSSVEVDGDVATAEVIPSTEEILRKGREHQGS